MSIFEFTVSPYQKIPEKLLDAYTMQGKVPIFDLYFDGTKKNVVMWSNELINDYCKRFTPKNIRKSEEGSSTYGHHVCVNLLDSFEKYDIRNKNVAVVGSETPWIEAMLINLNNKVTTIDYNVPVSNYNNLDCKDYFNFFENNRDTFEAIVSFSSIEHSGLGRYGDPLDPDGDIKTMRVIHNNLKNDGILIWGAPVGKDALVWNAHRVYGEIRLPFVFENYEEIEWFGASKDYLFNFPLANWGSQPVVVLKKSNVNI